jgi:hypothetical protein
MSESKLSTFAKKVKSIVDTVNAHDSDEYAPHSPLREKPAQLVCPGAPMKVPKNERCRHDVIPLHLNSEPTGKIEKGTKDLHALAKNVPYAVEKNYKLLSVIEWSKRKDDIHLECPSSFEHELVRALVLGRERVEKEIQEEKEEKDDDDDDDEESADESDDAKGEDQTLDELMYDCSIVTEDDDGVVGCANEEFFKFVVNVLESGDFDSKSEAASGLGEANSQLLEHFESLVDCEDCLTDKGLAFLRQFKIVDAKTARAHWEEYHSRYIV